MNSIEIVRKVIIWALLSAISAAATLAAENGKIAFVSDRDGNAEIYIMNPDGSSQTRLTNNNSIDDNPEFSPDGTKIAFHSKRDDPSGANGEIYVMNVNGSEQTRITFVDGDAYSPTWSPDRTKIAFIHHVSNDFAIIVMNADGSGQAAILHSIAFLDSLDWSPDGTKFVASRDSGDFNAIMTINADGSNGTEILNGNDLAYFHHPTWAPDGLHILFGLDAITSFFPIFSEYHGLDIVNVNDNGRRSLFDGTSGNAAWSPDGMRITYNISLVGTQPRAIFVMNTDSSGHNPVTNSGARDYDPSWGAAAGVSISGRVTTPEGLSLRNASVTITDPQGISRHVTTGSFGSYRFDNVLLGQVYLISVSSKRYRFAPQTLQINATLTDVNFVGLE